MSHHTLAVLLFAGLVFQFGCILSLPKDPRPWTTPRYGSLIGGTVFFVSAIWLGVSAL